MKIHDWNPDKGDACQGDVLLFRIPDSIELDTSDEIKPSDNRLVLAEGEVTGHHHAIFLRNAPVMFREDGSGAGVVSAADTAAMVSKATARKKKAGTARLYRDPAAISALVNLKELRDERLAIGILVVEGGPVALTHDEHDAIRIPTGRYYVGGQQEWDAGEARRVKD